MPSRPDDPPDALALAADIRWGRLSAREALDAALSRAEAAKPLGAIRFLDAMRARERADQLDRLLVDKPQDAAAMPFFGVPFLMKDLGSSAAGFPVVCGSRLLEAMPPPRVDSHLAARFLAAGLVPFGVTTVPEFGLATTCEPVLGPLARNPLDPRRTPGGSSGGTAAAVAAGIVTLAQSGDAGGSTRVPAACCGLVGLKPTRGAVPGGPNFGNHLSGIAIELVISRSLRDTAAAFDAVTGRAQGPEPDPDLGGSVLARFGQPLGRLRIGLCLGLPDAIDPARREAVQAAGDLLARNGHALIVVPHERLAPLTIASAVAFDRIISVNLARNLGGLGDDDLARVEPLTRAVLARGRAISAVALQEAQVGAVSVAHEMWRLFDDIDVLLTPMLATAPPLIGAQPMDHDDVDLHWRRMDAFAPYAMLANIAGTPAMSVPFGFDDEGLPLPLHLVGPMGSDALLLRLARQFDCL